MPLRYGVRRLDEWTDHVCLQLTTSIALVNEGTEAGRVAANRLSALIETAVGHLAAVEKRVKERANVDGLPTFSTGSLYKALSFHLESIDRASQNLPHTDLYIFTTLYHD